MTAAVATLITGLQGNGKTLWVVSELAKLASKLSGDDPPIYVHGIKELTINRTASLLDPHRWHEVENGALVVIDEAQKIFPTRPNGSARPPKVAAFEDMRHRGLRAMLITQHPGLIDSDVRKLINRHVHVERLFGRQVAQVLEWPRCATPETKKDRNSAAKSMWSYPTKVYSLYKSSEVHNLKPAMPKAIKYAINVVIAAIALGAFAGYRAYTEATNPAIAQSSAEASATASAVTPAPSSPISTQREELDYFEARIPRLPGLPHTAAVYDGINSPKMAPKPVACAVMGNVCKCYTQQATLIPSMDQATCKTIVAEGWFDESADQEAAARPVRERLPS
ncbi:zonular occludens toxin domain-containing protein [Chitiniphilus purpureus]|uniref:Zonular occludens toxin domain-containing protein n=1 Tax=Chitiniphilus purpureus TaxID=2981137 RepID=A0ABY6DIC7_9NEIS|nr:zonular occludens toxin domain-containing protein [Chitiniphilus sp. CD1]UXY14086.1 zonular occludens toxin domain-containing protein [Chitiniphilus sp. CD1]